MELILLEKIKNLGSLGEIVKVRAGYGRNYLLPQGKAVPASEANRAAFEARRVELEQKQADELARAESRAVRLRDMSVIIAKRAGAEGKLFGSVSTSDIAEALTAAGVQVARQEVNLPNGPLRMIGEYEIAVQLHSDIFSTVKVTVAAAD